jgi:uncharacterized membrane protein
MPEEEVQLKLVAAVYPNLFQAQAKLGDLLKIHKAGTVELVDAAVLVRERSGKLTISDQAELTPGKGAKRGALMGAVIGVVFPPSLLAGAALGAAAGAITGKVTDQGFSNQMLEDLAKRLEPGESAILAATEPASYDQMLAAIDDYEELFERTLDTDESGALTLGD